MHLTLKRMLKDWTRWKTRETKEAGGGAWKAEESEVRDVRLKITRKRWGQKSGE